MGRRLLDTTLVISTPMSAGREMLKPHSENSRLKYSVSSTAHDAISNMMADWWLTAAEECQSRALRGTEAAFVDRFRNTSMTSNNQANSRASSLAPSKPSAGPSRSSTPQNISLMPNDRALTPDKNSTDATFLTDSLGSPDQPTSSEEKGKGKGKAKSNTSEDSKKSDSEGDSSSSSEDEEELRVKGGTQGGSIGPYADWDNGEALTPKERAQIMKLSLYERSREMNIRRRKRMESDLAHDFRTLTDDMGKTRSKPSPASQKPLKAQHVADGNTDRRSPRKVAK
jgi:hypothetical protein